MNASMSLSTRVKSPEESGLNVTAPTPSVVSPSSVSRVTAAVASANSRSSRGPGSCLRPPKRTSLRPNLRGDRPAHLAGDLGERRQPLLDRRVIHEHLRHHALRAGRDDEERVHALDLAEV